MQAPIGKDRWYLTDWPGKIDWNTVDFEGREALAQQLLNQAGNSAFDMRRLRLILRDTVSFPFASDEELLKAATVRLTTGAWKARRHGLQTFPAAGKPGAVVAAPVKEERRAPSSSSPDPDPPVFPGDIDPAAIAQAQKEAAKLGVPFCEECVRAALAGK